MSHLVISTSLRYSSYSRILGRQLSDRLNEMGLEGQFLDLRHYPLPFATGEDFSDETLLQINHLRSLISAADAIAFASPIYNYGLNSLCHNLIALTGPDASHPITWHNKVIGIVAAAGGQGSYMAPLNLFNSLMLDYRCVPVPGYIYATCKDFNEITPSEAIQVRLERLAKELVLFTRSLQPFIHPISTAGNELGK